MNKLQLSLIALFSIFLVLISCSFAAAQSPYPTSKVTPVTIPLNGTFTGSAEGLGVSFEFLMG
jgi:hypothetical protein